MFKKFTKVPEIHGIFAQTTESTYQISLFRTCQKQYSDPKIRVATISPNIYGIYITCIYFKYQPNVAHLANGTLK